MVDEELANATDEQKLLILRARRNYMLRKGIICSVIVLVLLLVGMFTSMQSLDIKWVISGFVGMIPVSIMFGGGICQALNLFHSDKGLLFKIVGFIFVVALSPIFIFVYLYHLINTCTQISTVKRRLNLGTSTSKERADD